MPRLSHTLDLDALNREDLVRSDDGAYLVIRSARFDERGHLLLPDHAELERLELLAEEAGLFEPGARLARQEREKAEATRLAEEVTRLRQEMAEQEAEHGRPRAETRMAVEERMVELAVLRSQDVLRLVEGEHLAAGSRYLLSSVDEDGAPVFTAETAGWVGTDLTIASWDEEGMCAVDFAMREDPELSGFEDPVTTGTVEHDRAAQVLTVRARMRFPAPVSMVKKDSGLLRVEIMVRIDLPAWYAALSGEPTPSGGSGPLPAHFEVRHPLVLATGTATPSPGANGRWSVATSLEVRGRGLARPLVAVVLWALARSLRRSKETSVREWVAEVERSWARIARSLPALPGLLAQLAESMSHARARSE